MNKAFRDLPSFLEIAYLRPKVKKTSIFLIAALVFKPSSTSISPNCCGRSVATRKIKVKTARFFTHAKMKAIKIFFSLFYFKPFIVNFISCSKISSSNFLEKFY